MHDHSVQNCTSSYGNLKRIDSTQYTTLFRSIGLGRELSIGANKLRSSFYVSISRTTDNVPLKALQQGLRSCKLASKKF
jgi:hypothetical protein